MKTKKHKSKEKSLPKVEEPVATYGPTAANSNDVIIPNLSSESLGDKPEGFDAYYAKLKAEADEKFGNKELMTGLPSSCPSGATQGIMFLNNATSYVLPYKSTDQLLTANY